METDDENAGAENAPDVVDAIIRASRALVRITVSALAAASDEVTLPQLRTLAVVAARGPQTVSALAEGLDVHASTMTRMCSRLVARGLVVRTPSEIDRREVVIALTPPGQSLVDIVLEQRHREIDAVVQRMTAEDRDRVISALQLFSEAAGAGTTPSDDVTPSADMIAPPIPEETGSARAR
jgi:DNA-binding MarR family transcriptional regulator